MAELMKAANAIKTFFEHKDAITPDGGRPVANQELMALVRAKDGSYKELAELCGAVLGVTIDWVTAKA